jgi:hypothetical protein
MSVPPLTRGNNIDIPFTARDQFGNIINLTGALAIKSSFLDPTTGLVVIEKTLAGGGISVVSATEGTGLVNLVPADTEPAPPAAPLATQVYPFDVQVTDASGEVHTVLQDNLPVEFNITSP